MKNTIMGFKEFLAKSKSLKERKETKSEFKHLGLMTQQEVLHKYGIGVWRLEQWIEWGFIIAVQVGGYKRPMFFSVGSEWGGVA